MPSTYKGVLFDLDGTLLDTLADIGCAANRVMASHEFPTHPIEGYRLLIGDGAAKLVERALPPEARDPETVGRCLEAYRRDYAINWRVNTRPYDGIPELLDAIVARGLRMAVLSNKPDDFTRSCVSGLLGKWPFDVIIGSSDALPNKPHPGGAQQIARRLAVPPEQWIYVGDTAVDMRTAVSAGMFPVGVLWGFRGREELEESGAQALIERPLDLLGLLA